MMQTQVSTSDNMKLGRVRVLNTIDKLRLNYRWDYWLYNNNNNFRTINTKEQGCQDETFSGIRNKKDSIDDLAEHMKSLDTMDKLSNSVTLRKKAKRRCGREARRSSKVSLESLLPLNFSPNEIRSIPSKDEGGAEQTSTKLLESCESFSPVSPLSAVTVGSSKSKGEQSCICWSPSNIMTSKKTEVVEKQFDNIFTKNSIKHCLATGEDRQETELIKTSKSHRDSPQRRKLTERSFKTIDDRRDLFVEKSIDDYDSNKHGKRADVYINENVRNFRNINKKYIIESSDEENSEILVDTDSSNDSDSSSTYYNENNLSTIFHSDSEKENVDNNASEDFLVDRVRSKNEESKSLSASKKLKKSTRDSITSNLFSKYNEQIFSRRLPENFKVIANRIC